MAFLETAVFCSTQEYERDLPKRIHESSLGNDDIYTFMARLNSKERHAAKLAVQTLEVKHKAGITAVHFTFLNENMKPYFATIEKVVDGLITHAEGVGIKDEGTEHRFPIIQAYFKDFFDVALIEALAENAELNLTC